MSPHKFVLIEKKIAMRIQYQPHSPFFKYEETRAHATFSNIIQD